MGRGRLRFLVVLGFSVSFCVCLLYLDFVSYAHASYTRVSLRLSSIAFRFCLSVPLLIAARERKRDSEEREATRRVEGTRKSSHQSRTSDRRAGWRLT